MKNLFVAAVFCAMCGVASASIVLDPGTALNRLSTNGNDAYNLGRGALFRVNNSFTLNTVGLTSNFLPRTRVTYMMYRASKTEGDVLSGASLLRSTTIRTTLQGLASHTADIEPVQLIAGNEYLIRAVYAASAVENWYYEFDPVYFGDLPVNLGDITLIDGTQAGSTHNFVLPEFTLNVPAPSSLLGFGLAGLIASRRSRSQTLSEVSSE